MSGKIKLFVRGRRKSVMPLVALTVVFAWSVTAQAVPIPVWSNTLDSDATSTVDGGVIINPPSTYVPGAIGNAFAGNNSVYAEWDNAEVATIFDTVWDDSKGSTVDLYFSGSDWAGQKSAGDQSGLWSVVDRFGGDDSYYIVQTREGTVRVTYQKNGGPSISHHLTTVPLTDDTTYRLTVLQRDNGAGNDDFEIYLDGGAYSNASPIFATEDGNGTYPFPDFNDGTVSGGGREMTVGNRGRFGGILGVGEWVDNINVFNGYHTPAELDIPEPTSVLLMAVAFLPALLRRRRA